MKDPNAAGNGRSDHPAGISILPGSRAYELHGTRTGRMDKTLMMVIARATHNGLCRHLSLDKLAEAIERQPRQTSTRLKRLVSKGLLASEPGASRGRAGRSDNRYKILIEVLPEDRQDVGPDVVLTGQS